MSWLFIDDQAEEASAFAGQLGAGTEGVAVQVSNPGAGRRTLFLEKQPVDGVLMDIDLSGEVGELGSGAGIAQDARLKQRAGEISEFPIVRFAGRSPIAKRVTGDPASDDLFDLKIQKEELRTSLSSVQRRLTGARQVYSALEQCGPDLAQSMPQFLGLAPEVFERWCHRGFLDRLTDARQTAVHVGAATLMRAFLTPPGLLVNEFVLSIRLGVDPSTSADWAQLLRHLEPLRYQGAASGSFLRWWARGLEEWWATSVDSGRVLASLTIAERVNLLQSKVGLTRLTPLQMPSGSAGERPWRLCSLSLEAEPKRFVPIDPDQAVRITPRADLPPWTDAPYAALGVAAQAKADPRINKADLARLSRKHR